MRYNDILAVISSSLLVVFLSGQVKAEGSAVRRIDLNDHRSEKYLPYTTRPLNTASVKADSYLPIRASALLLSEITSVREGIFARISNPPSCSDEFSQLSFQNLRSSVFLRDVPVRLTLTDILAYRDSLFRSNAVAVGGFRNDSAFVFKASLDSAPSDPLCLATGRDLTGDGSWTGRVRLLAAMDFDFDGRQELFCYVDPIRDLRPRVLVCVELESMTIEWTVPVASQVYTLLSTHDSANPAVLIATYGPDNGTEDASFSDRYGYIAKIDRFGRPSFVKPSSGFCQATLLTQGENDSVFYVAHTIPLTAASGDDSLRLPTLTKIGTSGDVLESITLTSPANSIMLVRTGEQPPRVCVLDDKTVLSEYDERLVLQAESGPSTLTQLRSKLDGWRDGQVAVIAASKQGYMLYDSEWRLMGHVKVEQPAIRDVHGNVTGLFGSWSTGMVAEQLVPRGFVDYLTTLYLDYQNIILVLLGGLGVGLVATNYYRRRTKCNLSVISQQKKELEATHKALREAQQSIVDQEKYRQAQDIAGGFAHEIRNALFPSEGSLTKLRALIERDTTDNTKVVTYADRALRSITRALSMTDLVLQYTRLDRKIHAEPVNLNLSIRDTIAANQQRIDESGVAVTLSGNPDVHAMSNREQLEIVLNNLVVNSLDALSGRPHPRLDISWETLDEHVFLIVADNGVGISDDARERVFDTFFTTKPHGGTGLGLSMSKKIIELYDGSISFDSRTGEGTTFRLEMTLAREKQS